MKKLQKMCLYWSSVPTIGLPEDTPHEVAPYEGSLLAAEVDQRDKFYGWKWIGWQKDRFIYALLDLCGETYVDHVKVTLRVPADKNMRTDYQRIILSARTEDEPRYRVCARFLKQEESEEMQKTGLVVMELPVKRKVRCLNLQFTRGEWWNMPVPYVEVFGEEVAELKAPYGAEVMEEEWQNEAIVVDQYGQATYIDYPGKITCDEDLKRDAATEWEHLKNVELENEKYDRYGGMKTGKNYGATGFFRVEKVDGVWWFISPEGNLFFLKGIDGITYDESSHYTPLYRKDTTIVRGVFEELPDKEELPCAYKMHKDKVPCVDFQEANLRRKYGEDYRERWAEVTHRRLRDWNFNASGKWKMEKELYSRLPRIDVLVNDGELINTKSGWDPWDPEFEAKVDRMFARQLPQRKDDPMIIGYHFQNEDGWEMDDFARILHTTDRSFPAKEAFVNFMKERYKGDLRVVNVVLDTEVSSFEELVTTDLDMAKMPKADAVAFVQESSRRFHSIMSRVFKKYDPNHLFFGCTPVLTWRACFEWIYASAEFVDVLAVDWYFSQSADWMRPYLVLDKPMINIEFGWVSCERGHGPFFHAMTCENEQERAERYTRYVRNQAKVPQFIGIGYFIYSDQEISGRSNGNGGFGECHQFGVVSTQDQPYPYYTKVIREVNAELEELHKNGAPQE